MAERKQLTCNSFVFYGSFYEAISVLPLENQARIYDAIFKFAFENIETELDGIELAVFLLIKPQLLANRAKYENGCKGGRPRKQDETESQAEDNRNVSETEPNDNRNKTEIKPKQNLTETKAKPNENDNVNENVDIKEKDYGVVPKEKTTRFLPPTLEEVRNYCQERDNSVDAEKFYDFYQSKGWYVGKNKMKDWRAAVRTWEKEAGSRANTQRSAAVNGQPISATGNPFLDLIIKEGGSI